MSKICNHPPTSIELKQELLASLDKYDETDPRSTRYIRVFKRPTIAWAKIALCLVLTLIVFIYLLIKTYYSKNLFLFISFVIAFWLLWILIFGKKTLITIIKIYQRFAPIEIRKRCVFEPSCSEYAILVLNKYGLIKGIVRIIRRLKRCKLPNGGYDPA